MHKVFFNLMAANATRSIIPTSGLVFHASFRKSLDVAETGQTLTPEEGCDAALVEDCGRMVMQLNTGVLTFCPDDLPVDNAPFTIAVKAKLPYVHGAFILLGWGAPGQIAGLSVDSVGVGFHDWGEANTGQFADVMGWHHYAATYDCEQIIFYVDGHVNAVQKFDAIYPGDDTGAFGNWWERGGDGEKFANARIYNRALSAAEIAVLAKEE